MIKTASLQDLKNLKAAAGEFALIDVRERGLFGFGHLLLSTHVAFSDLELRMPTLVPRIDTPIIVMDAGQGIAARAARALVDIGYRDVATLPAGQDDWRNEGFEVFVGDDPMPKGFGEIIETVRHTPSIEPDRLRAMMAKGEKFVLLDGRSEEEFRTHSVPGAISVPNGELLWRVGDLVPDDDTIIVVGCAGRTRSIVGAQTLIDAGIRNPVYALRGGTQAWRMAGHALDAGKDPALASVSRQAAERSVQLSQTLEARTPIPTVSGAEIVEARGNGRTVYLIDIRTRAEFNAGHINGAMHIPGGQLVQTITRWCATKNALVALIEGAPNVRATTTAYWLRQMGWDARIVSRVEGADLSPQEPALSAPGPNAMIGCNKLRDLLGSASLLLIDAGPGMDYRQAHLPGAEWIIRPRVGERQNRIKAAEVIVVYADTDNRASLVASDIKALAPGSDVRVLGGGKVGWVHSGGDLHASADRPTDADCIDYLFWTHDRLRGNDEASAEYFRWELALPDQLARDGSVKFAIAGH